MALTQISTAGVKDDAVTAGKIPADAVGSSEIAANAVGSSELADNAVDTAAIADDAVTTVKIADNSVTAAKLADVGAIDNTNQLGTNVVTTVKIADDAVTADKLANSINTAIAANTAKNTNATHTGDVTGSGSLTIANNAVTTAKIADDAITNAKIADNAIQTVQIAVSQVTSNRIADQAVTLAKIEHGTSSNDGKFLRANNGADPSFETITVPVGIPSGGIIIWSGAANAIPSGFVICDGGNSTPDLRDRFVVGAGSSYGVDDTGGATSVTLTSNQIPAHGHAFSGSNTHNHSFTGPATNPHNNTEWGQGDDGSIAKYMTSLSTNNATISISGTTSNTGGGASHENRPPYYALCYIMKT